MSRQNDWQFWKGIPHCRIRFDALNSPAWRCLSMSARALYADLRARLRSCNNGNIACPLSEMKHRGWRSSATLSNALYELQALGFLIVTRRGGVERGSKVCNLYAFTDLPITANASLGIKESKESLGYAKFTSVNDAQRAKDSGVAELREASKKRKQKKNDASKIEQVKRLSDSNFEQVGHSSYSISEQVKEMPNAA